MQNVGRRQSNTPFSNYLHTGQALLGQGQEAQQRDFMEKGSYFWLSSAMCLCLDEQVIFQMPQSVREEATSVIFSLCQPSSSGEYLRVPNIQFYH